MNSRCDQIDIVELGWPEVDVDRLPRACLVLKRHLNSDRISLVHVAGLSFGAKRELIEAEVQSCGQRLKPVRPRGIDAEVEVLRSPRPLCKTQFHGDASFEVICAQNTFSKSSLQKATEREKR